jgi:hypothetical protein
MMDPLSALGVAASVVQFVDFAGKIVFKARDIYKSSQGSLQENDQTETVTKRLQEMANQLNNAVHQSKAHLAAGGPSNEPLSFAVRISDVCKECIEVSKELLSKLGNLKVPKDSQHRRWKSFRQALKSVCSKHEVEALAKRLRCLKDEINSYILEMLRQVLPNVLWAGFYRKFTGKTQIPNHCRTISVSKSSTTELKISLSYCKIYAMHNSISSKGFPPQ